MVTDSTVLRLSICVIAFAVLFTSGCRTAGSESITLEPSIQEDLKPVHPDEDADYTFNHRFSLNNALGRIGQLKGLASRMNPGEESMAFQNWIGAIEGTMKKQDYQIRKLEFELAKFQQREGEITKSELDEKKAAYEEAAYAFKSFWNSFSVSD